MAEGDLSSAVGLFLTNLEKEAGTPIRDQYDRRQGRAARWRRRRARTRASLAETKAFYYDEWDFRAADYKPRWCRVLQRPLEEGDDDFFENTLRRNSAPRQRRRASSSSCCSPEMFRKIKRLQDGEDFDLDAVIEYADGEARRPQLHATRSTGAATRSSATSPWRSCST